MSQVYKTLKSHLSGRKEMFYLTTHSTHFIYGYTASNTPLRMSDNCGPSCETVTSCFHGYKVMCVCVCVYMYVFLPGINEFIHSFTVSQVYKHFTITPLRMSDNCGPSCVMTTSFCFHGYKEICVCVYMYVFLPGITVIWRLTHL